MVLYALVTRLVQSSETATEQLPGRAHLPAHQMLGTLESRSENGCLAGLSCGHPTATWWTTALAGARRNIAPGPRAGERWLITTRLFWTDRATRPKSPNLADAVPLADNLPVALANSAIVPIQHRPPRRVLYALGPATTGQLHGQRCPGMAREPGPVVPAHIQGRVSRFAGSAIAT